MENTIKTGGQLTTNNKAQVKKKGENTTQVITSSKNDGDKLELTTKLEKAKKQNGLIEKAADKIKGKLNIGLSSKKIEEKIANGASEEEILKDIKNYKKAQENTAHAIVDTLVGIGSVLLYIKMKDNSLLQAYKGKISGNGLFKGNEKLMSTIGATCAAMQVGGISKSLLMSMNRIGTDQYKVKKDEKMDDDEFKMLKNATRKDKANANLRNFATGAISGLTAPLTVLGGGFVGAPLYVLTNSLSRYFIGTKEDASDKSFGSYVENLKTSGITNAISAAALLAVAMKKGVASAKFEKNLVTAFNNINASGVLKPYSNGKTNYEKLAQVLLDSDEAQKVLTGSLENTKIKEILADGNPWIYGLGSENTESLLKHVSNSIGDKETISLKQLKGLITEWASSNKLGLEEERIASISQDIMEEYGTKCKDADEMYKALSENTFFLKILQIQENSNNSNGMDKFLSGILGIPEFGKKDVLEELIKKLKTDGPRTYSTDEVKDLINKAFGGKYTLVSDNPLGVGTVAETYLVKDASGKEVVAKFLKKGVDSTGGKIAEDAKECLEIIKKTNLPEHEKATLLSSMEDIAKGVIKEADLAHEMQAAEKLGQSTTLAKVAKGIEVSKDGGIYVMEKADGFCLQKVSDYLAERRILSDKVANLQKELNADATGQRKGMGLFGFSKPREQIEKDLAQAEEALEIFEKQNEGMKGFANLGNDEARSMLELYQDVLVEQFNKVDPKGKVIHADIHPGNIMINPSELKKYASGDKAAKSRVFTLIDTGNTIEQTPEIAMRFLNLSKYIDAADTDNIVEFVLEGAKLPSGKIYSKSGNVENIASAEEMDKYFKIIKEKLAGADGKSGVFFDSQTGLGKLTNQELIENITNKMLHEEGITPSNIQGNLIKAQTSAKNSLSQFKKNNNKTLFQNITGNGNGKGNTIVDVFKTLRNPATYRGKQRKQEKANLKKLSPTLRAKMRKGSKSAPKRNSVEYLTYVLKQDKVNEQQRDMFEFLGDII